MTQPGGGRSGPDTRFMVPYEGLVTKRDDPEKRGRIKLSIPGLIEPETPDWVFPIGVAGGGTAQRGHIEPPDVGANVVVLFVQGNPDKPRYLVGPWGNPGGTSDAPTNHEVEGNDRQNAVTEDEEWRIERDSRSSEKKFTITHRSSDLQIVLEAATGSDNATIRTSAGQTLTLEGTSQKATLDSGFGPALTLDGAGQTVALELGSGPKLELFAGGFALSAGSAPEFAGTGGKAKVGDRNATEKMMLGTTYRTDEAALLNALIAALQVFSNACKAATIEPVLGPAATALDAVLIASPCSDSPVRTNAAHTGYLSQNVDVQD